MLGESLLTLAALAGQMVVRAAATDAWETAEHRYAKMLGRGDAKRTQLAEQRLEETREQLAGEAGADMEMIRTALAGRWTGRWADLLEEAPGAEAELRGFVQEIQTAPPAERLFASDHAVFANDDVSSYAAGPEHPGALATRSEFAYSAGQAGDAAAARDQFAALLPVAERVLGPEHPDTLAARASLAYWIGQAGDAIAARDRFAALLPVAERVLGPEHPDTLINRHNHANFTGYAGDAAAARDQFAALLRVRERVFGADSPTPWWPGSTWPTGPGAQGMQPPPGTSSPRYSPSASACMARTTPAPWPRGWNLPTGQGAPGPPQRPGTSSQHCSPSLRRSSAPSTQRPWPSGINLPTGLRWRRTSRYSELVRLLLPVGRRPVPRHPGKELRQVVRAIGCLPDRPREPREPYPFRGVGYRP